LIVDVNARRVVHVAVTRAQTERVDRAAASRGDAVGQGPQVIIRDRDDKFGAVFDRVAAGAGARVVRTAVP
jgi:hypothetical protein